MNCKEIKERVKAAWGCLTSRWWLLCYYRRKFLRVVGNDNKVDIAEALLEDFLSERKEELGCAGMKARMDMIDAVIHDTSVLLVSEIEKGRVAACFSLGSEGKVKLGELAEAAETFANEEIRIFTVTNNE